VVGLHHQANLLGWSAKADGPSRQKAEVDRLEEALGLEARRCAIKEDEIQQMRTLLVKLEDLVQRQDEMQQEEDRLSSIELSLGQQQADTEEKVAKLLLAVAGEKHRAEAAERSREEAQWANEATFKQLEASLEIEQAACQKLRFRVGELEDCMELPRVVHSPSRPPCPVEVGIGGDACTGIPGEHPESAAMKELQQQLHEEREVRLRLQAKLLEKDSSLRMPWRLDDSTSSTNSSVSEHVVSCDMGQPYEQETERHLLQPADSGSGPSDKDHIIQELQHQLADEVGLRRDAQGRIAELGRQLSELEYSTETKDVSQQQALQNRLITKDREVCELQDQLVEELEKRQQMQYRMIQKDQAIFDLQQRLKHVSSKTQTPASPQPSWEADADAVGCSSHIQVAPKSLQNAAKCNGNGFGSPVPLGCRPPLPSGPQLLWMQSSSSFGVVRPWQAGKLQRVSGTFRRGMYIQQQQQPQGSSIMDGCSMSVHAATFCLPPGVSSHEVCRSLHGC